MLELGDRLDDHWSPNVEVNGHQHSFSVYCFEVGTTMPLVIIVEGIVCFVYWCLLVLLYRDFGFARDGDSNVWLELEELWILSRHEVLFHQHDYQSVRPERVFKPLTSVLIEKKRFHSMNWASYFFCTNWDEWTGQWLKKKSWQPNKDKQAWQWRMLNEVCWGMSEADFILE